MDKTVTAVRESEQYMATLKCSHITLVCRQGANRNSLSKLTAAFKQPFAP